MVWKRGPATCISLVFELVDVAGYRKIINPHASYLLLLVVVAAMRLHIMIIPYV